MNPEDQQIYEEPYEEVYDDPALYQEERVEPVIDLAVLQMPFWLKISLLTAALVVLGAVVLFSNMRYQGPKIEPAPMPESTSSLFPPMVSETGISPSSSQMNNQQTPPANVTAQKYPQTYDSGDIYVERKIASRGVHESSILFRNNADGETYKVVDLLSSPIWYSDEALFFADNKLYYFGPESKELRTGSSQIFYVDLKTFSQGIIDRKDTLSHPKIVSIYVYNDDLYYLSGTEDAYRCADGPARDCVLSLRKVSLNDFSQNTLLATSTPATTFIGYASAQDALFMYTGYGDAGCVGMQLYIYENKSLAEGPELGGCSDMLNGNDSPEYLQYFEEMEKLERAVARPVVDAIQKSYNQYLPSSTEYQNSLGIAIVE